MRSKSTRLLPSDAELYLLLGIASLQPVANFVRANITDQAFVLNRSVGYFAVIFTTASLAFLLTNLICRVKDKFIVAFAIALAVLFFFNHHIIAALFLDIGENLFGVFVRFRYVLLGQGVL